jgi:hypothetical protein
MLFDLRSRGRRRTVQVLYIGLAILIGSGLILFGVGTGGGGGGLLGAFTGNGSSNSSNTAVTAATKKAIAATRRQPQSAAAWANLVNARFSAANSVGYDSNTNVYTAAGKQQLALVIQAYARYTKLTKSPSADAATIAAEAYSKLGRYSNSATVYQTVLTAEPGSLHGLECVAFESFAASTKTTLESAKKTPSVAAESC